MLINRNGRALCMIAPRLSRFGDVDRIENCKNSVNVTELLHNCIMLRALLLMASVIIVAAFLCTAFVSAAFHHDSVTAHDVPSGQPSAGAEPVHGEGRIEAELTGVPTSQVCGPGVADMDAGSSPEPARSPYYAASSRLTDTSSQLKKIHILRI